MFGWFENLDFRFVDLIDIAVVAFLIYGIIHLIKGTRALYMLMGLVVLLTVYFFSSFWDLYTLHWILSNFLGSLFLFIVILFQSDIRRALTRLGRTKLLLPIYSGHDIRLIEEVVRTCTSLANRKIGALIVLERDARVPDYVETGVELDAKVSKELIISIFMPSSPIHDGAVLIQNGRISAAGCFLPLTMNPDISGDLGTRHRAALGLTEETDAIVVVVSEEKGWISLVREGQITQGLDSAALRKLLHDYIGPSSPGLSKWRLPFWTRRESEV